MNISTIINALSDTEKEEALNILRKWEREKAEKVAETIVLTDMEKAMVANKENINCIKSIRDRTEYNLVTCKIAMEDYIASIRLPVSLN